MRLKILLPFGVFTDTSDVQRMVVETDSGNFGLLPQRLDCVAAVVPGILIYQRRDEQECYIAVDEGILVKTGTEVAVSVRHAIRGDNLATLRDTVEQEFAQQSAQDLKIHSVYQKMESDFIRRLSAFRHER